MVLENKLVLTDSAELVREEERISKKKALALFEIGMLDALEPGTFEALKVIRKYLYDEIYEFAGQLRTSQSFKGELSICTSNVFGVFACKY